MITSDSIEKYSRIIARVAVVKGLTPFHPRFDLVIDSSHLLIYGSSQRIHCRTSFMPYRGNSGGSSGNGGDGCPSPRTENFLLTISTPLQIRHWTNNYKVCRPTKQRLHFCAELVRTTERYAGILLK